MARLTSISNNGSPSELSEQIYDLACFLFYTIERSPKVRERVVLTPLDYQVPRGASVDFYCGTPSPTNLLGRFICVGATLAEGRNNYWFMFKPAAGLDITNPSNRVFYDFHWAQETNGSGVIMPPYDPYTERGIAEPELRTSPRAVPWNKGMKASLHLEDELEAEKSDEEQEQRKMPAPPVLDLEEADEFAASINRQLSWLAQSASIS